MTGRHCHATHHHSSIHLSPPRPSLLLQAPSHSSRLDIFSKIIGEEQKRLAAREQLKSMFKGVGDS